MKELLFGQITNQIKILVTELNEAKERITEAAERFYEKNGNEVLEPIVLLFDNEVERRKRELRSRILELLKFAAENGADAKYAVRYDGRSVWIVGTEITIKTSKGYISYWWFDKNFWIEKLSYVSDYRPGELRRL